MRRHWLLPASVLVVFACATGVEVEEAPSSSADAGTVDAAVTPRPPPLDASADADSGPERDASVPEAAPPDASAEWEVDPPLLDTGPSPCVRTMVIDPTLGATKSGTLEQCGETLDRPVLPTDQDDSCRTGGPFPLPTYYAYVELQNPASHPVTVELRLDSAAGGEWISTYLAAYEGMPSTEAERNACLTGVNARCPVTGNASDPRWPCLIGAAAVTIPASGMLYVYVPQHNPPSQPAGATPARFVVRATDVGH